MGLTPTDFWFVCPMSQLRLADNSGSGSLNNDVKCLKHCVAMTQAPEVKSKVEMVPNWMLGLLIWAIKKACFQKNGFFLM